MTPKEKAESLIEQIDGYIYTSNAHSADEEATIKCGLLICHEMISTHNTLGNDMLKSYWMDIQAEIRIIGRSLNPNIPRSHEE